jgi:type IV pilus assembly protein PilB
MPVKLGELLLKENMVTPKQLQEALSHQKMNGGKLGKAFVYLGYVRDEEITRLLSRQYGVPSINLDHFEVDPAIIKIIPAETTRKYQILPLSRRAPPHIAMADPTNVFAMDDIVHDGYNVGPWWLGDALEDAIDRHGPPGPRAAGDGGGGGGVRLRYSRRKPQGRDGRPALTMDDMASGGLGGRHRLDVDGGRRREVKAEDEIDLNMARFRSAPVIKLTNVLLVDSLKRASVPSSPTRRSSGSASASTGSYNVMAPMR